MIVSELLQRMKNGAVVFLDGRNEHGSHVLPSFPTWLEIELTEEALHEQAEEIISKAERLGFAIGDHVWARFTWIREEYHHGYWEFEEIDADLSRLICPAEEDISGAQRSELTRLAQDEPVSSPPSTGGEGEDWDRIPRAKRFGRRLNESAVKHLAPGTLLRFYSEDPWFDPSPSSPANGDIVVFTGEVSNTFPNVGPHLEVRTLGGRVYPGGGWVYQIFQFVADPSPEVGDISREEIAREIDAEAFSKNPWDATEALAMSKRRVAALDKADAKLKENGLSREELGGLARSQPGRDAQERSPVPPLSDGEG